MSKQDKARPYRFCKICSIFQVSTSSSEKCRGRSIPYVSFVLIIRDDLCKAISASKDGQQNDCSVLLVSVILHPLTCVHSLSFPLPCPRNAALRTAPPWLFAFCLWLSPASGQHREETGEMEKLEVMPLPPSLPAWFRMLLAAPDNPFSRTPGSARPSSITRLSLALSSPCVLMPSCFSAPGGFFGPDHTSASSLFDKIYWQILLGILSVPVSHPGSYLTHLDSEFLAGKGSDSCLIIFLKPSTVSMIGGIFRF